MSWIAPLIGLVGFEVIADIFAKEYSLRGEKKFWFLAIAGFIICNIFWLQALRNGSGLVRGGVIFSVSTALLVTLLGYYFYNEELETFQTIGIVMGIISLALIFGNK